MLSNPKFDSDTPPTNVDISSPTPTISTLFSPDHVAPASISAATSSSAVTDGKSSSMIVVKPKLDAIWLMATGKAKEVSNRKCLKWHTSAAMKKATKMHYKEQKRGCPQNKYPH